MEAGAELQLEPPTRIWNGIVQKLQVSEGVDTRGGFWNQIRSAWQMPRLVYSAAALVLLVGVSIVYDQVIRPSEEQAQQRYLAELDAYTLEVPRNPFFSPATERGREDNPFFEFSETGRNPNSATP